MVVHDKSNVRVVFLVALPVVAVAVAVATVAGATIWVLALTLVGTGAATDRG